MQGRLVPQNPEDEPASVLLERIQAEKARLVKEGKIKKQKALPPVDESDVPYELPEKWVWTKLQNIGTINPRNQDISDDLETSFIPMPYISEKYGIPPISDVKNWSEIKSGYTHFGENDVVLAKITPCFQNGKSAHIINLKNGIGAGTTELHVFRGFWNQLNPKYVLLYLKSPNFILGGIPKMTGSAGQKRIPKDYFAGNPFPIPPLAEQHRIVERVDTLMKLCDELEVRQNTESERRRMLLLSSLNAIFDTKEPDGAATAREILHDKFDLLFDDKKSIAELRKTILQLAVQGRLVEQNPEDELASVLLEKIQVEKARLVKEGKIKKQKALPPVDLDEVPYDLPEGWVWTRLGELIELISGQHIQKSDYYDFPQGIPYITGPIDFGEKYPIISKWTDKPKTISKKNNILVTVKGAGLGKNNLVNLQELAISRQLMALNCIKVDYKYIFILIKSKYNYFQKKGVGIAIPGICRDDVTFIILPLPPLTEQHRIVERVDTLMKLCDELEERVSAKEDAAERLLLSVCDGICG
ncbi:restriction endonuclease subunit S [Methanogenium marinum]|uniref:Restriction endonuclease subunit S n=1 Tax=Methanogenium marinum TaxID=348610 RepID=A0A9Q4KR93_9EURY|nr:restriction endonuclease subunit S [Methanogenium marinum]MDE4907217.1 restriction endonuclease subunit S [Methanogenium marinum]